MAYSDYGDEATPSQAQGTMGDKPEKQDDDDGTSALLPKSIMAGKDFKPGDEIVLKINHIYDDEIEVSYAPEKPDKEEKPKSQMEESESALDKMAMEPGA